MKIDFKKVQEKILNDIAVKATEMFDRNFENQGFFGKKWQPRKNNIDPKRAILMGKGRLKRSLKKPTQTPNKLQWTLDVPYAKIHNQGGGFSGTQNVRGFGRLVKGKNQNVRGFKRTVNTKIPQRQFIGDSPELRNEIKRIVDNNIKRLNEHIFMTQNVYNKTPFNK